MSDYIKWIRSKVGHETIILNFSGAFIVDVNKKILLPTLFTKQHLDEIKDFFEGGRGIFR